jgi:hypothetical protein
VVLVFLLVLNTALALLHLFLQKMGGPLLLYNLLADLTLGLVAGLGARIVLRQRHALIRFIVATATLIIGLFIIGLFTQWRIGFGPLNFWSRAVDWDGLLQLSIGIVTLTLALAAWPARLPVETAPSPAVNVAPEGNIAPAVNITPTVNVSPAPNPRPVTRRKTPTQPRSLSTPARRRPRRKTEIKSAKAAATQKQPTAPRRLFRRKPHVHLSKIERHLCPYCLDPVIRNDPRGVVECDICHTLHHADCWSIAGACQVPHYTA